MEEIRKELEIHKPTHNIAKPADKIPDVSNHLVKKMLDTLGEFQFD